MRLLILVGILSVVGQVGPPADPLTIEEVLFRANEAAIRYEQRFANVVAQEDYVQRILRPDDSVESERRLRSDVALVLLPGADSWIGFRDVLEVDGEEVGDREGRLRDLFVGQHADAIEQAMAIARESARYNLGDIRRTVNVPTVALTFLHPLNQHRFRFEKIAEETIDGTHTWVVRFSEHLRPTVVRVGAGDLFSRGRFWIDVESGSVVRSQLVLGDPTAGLRTTITVAFRWDEGLGIWVPALMEELYENPQRERTDRIVASAEYSAFRQFTVSTSFLQAAPPPH